MEQNIKPEKIKLSTVGNVVVVIFSALLIVAIGTSIYFYRKANANPEKIAKSDLTTTVAKVGKLMVLPTDETPTMATVSDPVKLKDQPFFVNAKTGDKVLIYSNARKAILYSPSLNKIIEVAPVNLGATASGIGQ